MQKIVEIYVFGVLIFLENKRKFIFFDVLKFLENKSKEYNDFLYGLIKTSFFFYFFNSVFLIINFLKFDPVRILLSFFRKKIIWI